MRIRRLRELYPLLPTEHAVPTYAHPLVPRHLGELSALPPSHLLISLAMEIQIREALTPGLVEILRKGGQD